MRVERQYDDRPVESVEAEPFRLSLLRLLRLARDFFFPTLSGQVIVTQGGRRPSP